MTLFSTVGIASSGIAGAVAESILYDIRENSSGLQGFPQITVLRVSKDRFEIDIQFMEHRQSFSLSNEEATNAVRLMKDKKEQDPAIFERVQKAFAALEAAFVSSH